MQISIHKSSLDAMFHQVALIQHITEVLDREFTSKATHKPILEFLSSNVTDYQAAPTLLVTLTFNNTLTQDEDPLYLNSYDIDDIYGILNDIQDDFNKTSQDLYYFTHTITPIACMDTAKPCQAIIITISLEY